MRNIKKCKASKAEIRFNKALRNLKKMSFYQLQKEIKEAAENGKEKYIMEYYAKLIQSTSSNYERMQLIRQRKIALESAKAKKGAKNS